VDPHSSVAPLRIATPKDETVVFASTPNIHHHGGWIQHLHRPDMPAVATKYFTGDLQSASPVLGTALAAMTLSGAPVIATNGAAGLPMLNASATLSAA